MWFWFCWPAFMVCWFSWLFPLWKSTQWDRATTCGANSPSLSCVSVQSSNTSGRVRRPQSDAISEYVYCSVNQNLNRACLLCSLLIFFKYIFFPLCHHYIFFPWNNLVRHTFLPSVGFSLGKQTGIRQWLGRRTLIPLIETSLHIKKKGKEDLKLGYKSSVMSHGVEESRRGLSSNDVFIVPPSSKCCLLNIIPHLLILLETVPLLPDSPKPWLSSQEVNHLNCLTKPLLRFQHFQH